MPHIPDKPGMPAGFMDFVMKDFARTIFPSQYEEGTRPDVAEALIGCTVCHSPTAALCSACKASRYCSSRCQQLDWHSHKLLCKKYKDIPPRPTKHHVLAIFFPANVAEPELVWVEALIDPTEEGLPQGLEVQDYLPKEAKHAILQYNLKRHKLLKDPFTIHTNRQEMSDKVFNLSIQAATGSEISGKLFNGPTIIARKQGRKVYCDATLADYRYALHYFVINSDLIFREEYIDGPISNKHYFRGIVSHCTGEQAIHNTPQFTQVLIHKDSEVPLAGEVSLMSKRIGVPVKTLGLASNDIWSDERWSKLCKNVGFNEIVSGLALERTVPKLLDGMMVVEKPYFFGNVLIYRIDHKDLSIKEVETMCNYLSVEVRRTMGNLLATKGLRDLMKPTLCPAEEFDKVANTDIPNLARQVFDKIVTKEDYEKYKENMLEQTVSGVENISLCDAAKIQPKKRKNRKRK